MQIYSVENYFHGKLHFSVNLALLTSDRKMAVIIHAPTLLGSWIFIESQSSSQLSYLLHPIQPYTYVGTETTSLQEVFIEYKFKLIVPGWF